MCTKLTINSPFWFFLLFGAFHLQAQTPSPPQLSGNYMALGGGLHYGYLRDPGVSPLIFSGSIPCSEVALLFQRPKHELEILGGFGYGNYLNLRSFISKTNINNFQHRVAYFHKVMESASGSVQLRAGLSYQGFTNYRVTTAFRNNSGVLESIHSLMGGLKFQWSTFRDAPETSWLFFKRKAGQRGWIFQAECLSAPVHLSWRPAFAYLSDFTGGEVPVGKQNQWALGGRHLYFRSNFQYFMRNGNAWKIGYTADLQKSGDTYYPLETAQYLTQLGLMVRLN